VTWEEVRDLVDASTYRFERYYKYTFELKAERGEASRSDDLDITVWVGGDTDVIYRFECNRDGVAFGDMSNRNVLVRIDRRGVPVFSGKIEELDLKEGELPALPEAREG
jgi:hypothetical protein